MPPIFRQNSLRWFLVSTRLRICGKYIHIFCTNKKVAYLPVGHQKHPLERETMFVRFP